MDLETPEKETVTVQPAKQYGTLWSQFISDTPGSKALYVILGYLFFLRLIFVSLYAPSIVLATKPQVYPIQIPSTVMNPPEQPVAYTAKKQFESYNASHIQKITRLPRLLLFALSTYTSYEEIAYIVINEDSDDQVVDSDSYLVTEDDDSLRPLVLFRD